MSKTEGNGKEQSADREALRAQVAYAVDFANWVKDAPQPPPQTTANTFNDILQDTIGELQRIMARHHLSQSLEDLQDGAVMADNDYFFEKAKEDVERATENLNCKSLL